MRTPDDLAFVVHVAGAPTTVFPGPDTPASATQRCAVCGFLLLDNSPWVNGSVEVAELPLVAVDGIVPAAVVNADRGMAWYPAGALIGTDKRDETRGGMTYVREGGRPLDANERACT